MYVLVVFMAIISTLEYMYVVGKRDRSKMEHLFIHVYTHEV